MASTLHFAAVVMVPLVVLPFAGIGGEQVQIQLMRPVREAIMDSC